MSMKVLTGDYVKFEVRDSRENKQAEWLWLRVDRCDEKNRVVFGSLDSEPIMFNRELTLGQHMAVSFDNIRDHKKPSDF